YPALASSYEVAYAPLSGQMKSFRVAGENSWLARACRKKHIDLIHHPGGTMPLFRTTRSVLTIHDLQYLFYPEYFTRTKRIFLKTILPRSAEAARMILVPSEYTRRTVIERLSIDPSLVIVVPHGISPRENLQRDPTIRERYSIPGPYFLYPAATYPHKNHLVLIEALAKVVETHPDVTLVLTGAKGWQEWSVAKEMGRRIENEIATRGISSNVRNLGYVPSEDLDALYLDAVSLVFPSRFEGFGAPVLEAMTRGCPVIAANATALPEVVETAGCLVSPDNAEEWAQAMTTFLVDEDARRGFVKLGLDRARVFDWDRSAGILEDGYRHALETTL
ncbi:MAG TPA: glycosyltransferase family 1 protein, partial [Actinomycetota bacterium]|nr:glycosyltransferase family 1 protein [Actinomycetota bacterium]